MYSYAYPCPPKFYRPHTVPICFCPFVLPTCSTHLFYTFVLHIVLGSVSRSLHGLRREQNKWAWMWMSQLNKQTRRLVGTPLLALNPTPLSGKSRSITRWAPGRIFNLGLFWGKQYLIFIWSLGARFRRFSLEKWAQPLWGLSTRRTSRGRRNQMFRDSSPTLWSSANWTYVFPLIFEGISVVFMIISFISTESKKCS